MNEGQVKKICVIGNFSGRNAGDNAILENLLIDISALYKDVEFYVPTINAAFINKTYKDFPLKVVPMMPWNLSLKIFGIPIFRAVLQSDLVLVTDAILFDRNLWNPLFNYLSTMSIVLPKAKHNAIPVVLYNLSLGPIISSSGKKCLKKVLDSSSLVIVRDRQSIDLLKQLHLEKKNIIQHSDCALNTIPSSPERLSQIKKDEGIVGNKDNYISFNVNAYVDKFVMKNGIGIGTKNFVEIMAETMDSVIEKLGNKLLLVVTQHMDISISETIRNKMRHKQSVTILTNKKYSHNELTAVMSDVGLHIGMRTHSLILASSTCTPIIGIVYRPKNYGYMKSIRQESRAVYFDKNFTATNLFALIQNTWDDRHRIRTELAPIIATEKEKARQSAAMLKEYLR